MALPDLELFVSRRDFTVTIDAGVGVGLNVGRAGSNTKQISDVLREPTLLDDSGDARHTEDEKAARHFRTGPKEQGRNVVHHVRLLGEGDCGIQTEACSNRSARRISTSRHELICGLGED